jgi:triacylglycerol lipase
VSMAKLPSPVKWLGQLASPWGAISTPIFAALWGITSRIDERYPCAARHADAEAEAALERAFGRAPSARANDGVVPLRSQVHGRVAWAGYADHLDGLGHFAGAKGGKIGDGDAPHVDWLRSGAGFSEARFSEMTSAIAQGMILATA